MHNRLYTFGWSERYDGPADDAILASTANTEIVDNLQGHLLLVHGELDDNVTPHVTMRLVDRLIAADRDFDLLDRAERRARLLRLPALHDAAALGLLRTPPDGSLSRLRSSG